MPYFKLNGKIKDNIAKADAHGKVDVTDSGVISMGMVHTTVIHLEFEWNEEKAKKKKYGRKH